MTLCFIENRTVEQYFDIAYLKWSSFGAIFASLAGWLILSITPFLMYQFSSPMTFDPDLWLTWIGFILQTYAVIVNTGAPLLYFLYSY
jgi:hypothetical protein